MTILGLSDPFIIGAYVACFACTALCIGWALFKRDVAESEDDE